jgi:hypothetical protein
MFEDRIRRDARGESPGMESVSTLNRFNDLVFKVYDLILVRVFVNLGLSMAGDIFTGMLDDQKSWRFHKGKYVSRMSTCFDYKHERKVRAGLI